MLGVSVRLVDCFAGYEMDTIVEGGQKLEISRRFCLDEIGSYLDQDNYQFWEYENRKVFYSNINMDCQFD